MAGKLNSKKLKSFVDKKKTYGRMFILVWEIGFVLFFLIPLAQSLIYSFSSVNFDGSTLTTEFIGLENYNIAFYKSPTFVENFLDSVKSFLYSMPFLLALSLIVAILLNQNFKGRTLMRAIFFIPVIISTGVIMGFINDDATALEMMSSGGEAASMYFQGLIDFNEIMDGLGLPSYIQELLMGLVNRIYQLVLNCGIPVILFISGLQSIPDQLYEASMVEGATKWEEFWHITFPMLNSTFVLVMVYISIDMFTSSTNKVMDQCLTAMQQLIYDTSSAMLWSYFALIGGGISIILFAYNRFFARKWE